jgi:hypothetical protein
VAKVTRKDPGVHVVIPDTNALWSKDKVPPVSPEFVKFWQDASGLVDLELRIPYVVRGELAFQQATSAIKAAERVSEGLRELSQITETQYRKTVDLEKVRSQVLAKLDRWIESSNGTVIPIPHAHIDWTRLCDDAIWRIAPFEFNQKNDDNEKGFRDALILESIRQYEATEAREVKIVIITGDELLRKSAKGMFSNTPAVSAHDSIENALSTLKLLHEQLTKEFIEALLGRARSKFFSSGDESSLYYSGTIKERISSEHQPLFDSPQASAGEHFLGDLLVHRSWQPIDSGKWWIGATEFERIVPERRFHWKSVITFVRKYQGAQEETPFPLPATLVSLAANERILILVFSVNWHASVGDTGRFSAMAVDNTDKISSIFRTITGDDRQRWGV